MKSNASLASVNSCPHVPSLSFSVHALELSNILSPLVYINEVDKTLETSFNAFQHSTATNYNLSHFRLIIRCCVRHNNEIWTSQCIFSLANAMCFYYK